MSKQVMIETKDGQVTHLQKVVSISFNNETIVVESAMYKDSLVIERRYTIEASKVERMELY